MTSDRLDYPVRLTDATGRSVQTQSEKRVREILPTMVFPVRFEAVAKERTK